MSQLVLFQRNLRTHDNPALHAAAQAKEPVLGLYCFEPKNYSKSPLGWKRTGPIRAKFIQECVEDTRSQLQELGSDLAISTKSAPEALESLHAIFEIKTLHMEKPFAQEECHLQKAIESFCKTNQIELFVHRPNLLNEEVPTQLIPDVFTPFAALSKKEDRSEPLPRPTTLKGPSPEILGEIQKLFGKLPSNNDLELREARVHPNQIIPFKGGETAARKRMGEYLASREILQYNELRNGFIGANYSSKFSPWLAQGCLSAQELGQKIRALPQNTSTTKLLDELLWRDFFAHIAKKHGAKIFQLAGINTRSRRRPKANEANLNDWTEGHTKNAFINAMMSELDLTGFLGNRGRQIAASYLVNDLNQPWTHGAWWFEHALIDYDPTQNWGNWLHASGNGTDPVADRRFNPEIQAKKFDSSGAYQRLWK